jgi:TolA-binding protein
VVARFKYIFVVSLACLLVSSCVYFNLYYNVKRTFKAAEKAPRSPDGEAVGTTADMYDDVIEKCQQLIVEHPKSKYVDDAILLMGKSFYAKRQYDFAVTKFQELQTNFPKSDLNEEGQVFLAKSYMGLDQPQNAVTGLEAFLEAKPKSKYADQVLFLLGTASLRLGDEAKAVKYLEMLAKRFPNNVLRLNADLELADLYVERGEFDKAMAIYKRLDSVSLNSSDSVRYLTKLSLVYVKMGKYKDALKVIDRLEGYELDTKTEASQMLLEAASYNGTGSIDKALDTYQTVTARYPRSEYAAEAYFRLGEIYQNTLDSLTVAREKYDQVTRQYPNSPFAQDALRRSVSITKLQQLRASLSGGGTEDPAVVKFELAETELLQFNNHEKALEGYQAVLKDFPQSPVAPKAAYAIAYIYEKVLRDKSKAEEAYQLLLRDYPDSQQAEYARKYLEGEKPKIDETRSDS